MTLAQDSNAPKASAAVQTTGAGTALPLPRGGINVKDWGAKGDGVSDDADAIQAAIDAAARLTKPFPRLWGAGFPEVIFPEGTYRISKTILRGAGALGDPALNRGVLSNEFVKNGAGFTAVRGQGKVTIRQDDPKADVFYLALGYRALLENLGFEGGRHSVKIYPTLQDVCSTVIRNCRFRDSRDYAIETVIRKTGARLKKGGPGDEYLGYCKRGEDGKLVDVDDPSMPIWYHSMLLHISGCDFTGCMHALFTAADLCVMEDCHIETNPEMIGPVIRNESFLRLENITGLAHVKEGKQQRWIDNDDGSIVLLHGRHLDLQTDGKGMCAVYNLEKFRLSTHLNQVTVCLEDSSFHASGSPENALIFCKEVPNIIAVSRCRETGEPPVPILGFASPGLQTEAYFKAPLHPGSAPIKPSGLAYTLEGGNTNLIADLPEAMKPYKRDALPSKVVAQIDKLRTIPQSQFLPASSLSFKTQVNALDFGIKGDGIADDTAAIQSALAQLEGKNAEITFPGTVYKITGKIVVPGEITIRGAGMAAFVASGKEPTGFVVPKAKRVAFMNCTFDGFDEAVAIHPLSGEKGTMLIDRCVFTNCRGSALKCTALDAKGKPASFAKATKNLLRVTDSVFWNNKLVLSSNVNALVDSCWISSYFHDYIGGENYLARRGWELGKQGELDKDAPSDLPQIQNDGILHEVGVLGVPNAHTLPHHFRWIDNAGALLCDSVRFGGEATGMIPLVVKPVKGTRSLSVILNSWLVLSSDTKAHPEDPTTSALVECEGMPDLLCLRNNVGLEESESRPKLALTGPTVQLLPDISLEAIKEHLFFSGNMIPETTGTLKKSVAE